MLKHDMIESQLRAAWILGAIGPSAGSAVPDLVPLLDHRDSRVRETAAAALRTIGGAGQVALDRALVSARPRDRETALSGMSAQPLDVRSRERLIAAGLSDSDPRVRQRAVDLLIPVKRDELDSLVRYLVTALNDSDPRVNESAHEVLTMYLQRGNPPSRFLAAVLESSDAGARVDVAWRLGGVDAPRSEAGSSDDVVVNALIKATRDPDPAVRVYAARAMAYRGGRSAAHGVEVLHHEMPRVETILRVRAAQALWHVSRRIDDVQQAYEAGLADPKKWNRIETISAIGAMGPAGKSFVPQLERLLNDSDAEVRDRAGKILYHIRSTARTSTF